jgi:hypothetical protein
MKSFNVIAWNYTNRRMDSYDVMPYLVEQYKKAKEKPETLEEYADFVTKESQYMWWARCQYEILLSDWPNQTVTEKWDIHRQILLNLHLVAQILKDNAEG